MNHFRTLFLATIIALAGAVSEASDYDFNGGYPTAETAQKVYDDLDLDRAAQAYRYFYPSVSMYSLWKTAIEQGQKPNRTLALLAEALPSRQVLTANADTPYGSMLIDLSKGPVVVEVPSGPLISLVDDMHQNWVMDLGLPGPDKGQGGKHLILPPEYQGEVPDGYFVGRAGTQRVLLVLRSMPKGGDIPAALELMKQIRVHGLNEASAGVPEWMNKSNVEEASLLLKVESTVGYWSLLKELIDSEPVVAEQRDYLGELAALGIIKGKPFEPDARMRQILEKAAQMGNAQLRVVSMADRSQDRIVWPERQWEWALLRPADGGFHKPGFLDLEAREKWFFQAILYSPAMFRRAPGAGSLYWMGSRDAGGEFLDGGKSYRLRIPQPVPARLFWSLTVYDAQTRSQIHTPQMRAAFRSLYDLKDADPRAPIDLYFGPTAPAGKERFWIRTEPGHGWFSYFRIYGPEQPAFDGNWKPGDFEPVDLAEAK